MIIAITIGAVISVVQIAFDYREELLRNEAQVERILKVISGGASQAAFELSKTEADAVLRPLLIHPFFSSVSIDDENSDSLAVISRDVSPHFDDIIFSPLTPPDKMYEIPLVHEPSGLAVGRINATVQSTEILHDFHIRAARTILPGIVRSMVMATILIFLFNRILTRPIVELVDEIKLVEAHDPREIEVPARISNANNELTMLANFINQTLSANRKYLVEIEDAKEETELVAEKLRHSERLSIIGQLVGRVSHDFNNILGVISGCFEILQERNDLNNDVKELTNIGSAAVQRGSEMTSKLLSYSRKQTLKPQLIIAKEYLRASSLFWRLALVKNIISIS